MSAINFKHSCLSYGKLFRCPNFNTSSRPLLIASNIPMPLIILYLLYNNSTKLKSAKCNFSYPLNIFALYAGNSGYFFHNF